MLGTISYTLAGLQVNLKQDVWLAVVFFVKVKRVWATRFCFETGQLTISRIL